MSEWLATITCPDCELTERFRKLQPARECLESHRKATGHDPNWELGEFSPGVVRAGDVAGICGMPEQE